MGTRFGGAVLAELACLLVATTATAQAAKAVPAQPGAESADAANEWSAGATRWFVGGQLAAGALAEARLVAGYGKPHWTWAGMELGAVSTTETGMAFTRARLALVLLDLAITWRRTWSYVRTAPLRESRYTDDDLDGSPAAQYGSVDLWAWGLAPVPFGLLDWELEASRVYGVEPGHDVYEEYLRGVTQPGWLGSARLGYGVMFNQRRMLLGPIGEATWLGDRGLLWRVGPDFSWTLSSEWDVAARVTVAVDSPDDLGFFNGLGGTLRARFRWAAGRP